jgi:cobalt-zinc-cadmium efflux system protein
MWFATAITFAFCLGEALVGYKSNSLALMADAGHNFADALALALSAFALWVATKPADNKRTFGYHRVGILAALVNAVGLVVMAIIIFWEAIQRLQNPEQVQSGPMIWVALLAIILNSGIAWWLASAAKEDLNIRSAYLHMLGDAAASLGVVIAGIIIAFTSWFIADPIVSIIFSLLVLWSSWSIFTESIQMLLEGIPVGMELNQVEQAIRNVPGVLDVHDLHVWTVSSGLIACNCHILVANQNVSAAQKIQAEVAHELEHDFKISHSTIQIESEDCGGHDHAVMRHHEHGHTH